LPADASAGRIGLSTDSTGDGKRGGVTLAGYAAAQEMPRLRRHALPRPRDHDVASAFFALSLGRLFEVEPSLEVGLVDEWSVATSRRWAAPAAA
jgi:hypothetical protein